jgi:hypothetical protein
MALLQTVVAALRNLMGNDQEIKEYNHDKPAWLEAHGVDPDEVSAGEVYTALDYLVREELHPRLGMLYGSYTAQAATTIGGSGPTIGGSNINLGGGAGTISVPAPLGLDEPGFDAIDGVLDIRNEYVTHVTNTTISDDDNIVDNRVTQDIFALGDVNQSFNPETAISGDGGISTTAAVTDSVMAAGGVTGSMVARDPTDVAFNAGSGSAASGEGVAAAGSSNAAGRDVIDDGALVGNAITDGGGTAQSTGGDANNAGDTAAFGLGATANAVFAGGGGDGDNGGGGGGVVALGGDAVVGNEVLAVDPADIPPDIDPLAQAPDPGLGLPDAPDGQFVNVVTEEEAAAAQSPSPLDEF